MKKTTKLLFLVIVSILLISCTNDAVENNTNDSNEILDFELSERPNVSEQTQIIFWVSGESWGVYLDGMRIGSMCLNMGICYIGTYTTRFGHFAMTDAFGGTRVKFTRLDADNLHVEILDATISVDEIQQQIDPFGDTDTTAQEIYNTLHSRVNLEEEMRLGNELSQLLSPEGNSEEIVILPGEYPIDYTNGEHGEFIVRIAQN